MSEENKNISIADLAEGLGMDRSNLKKLMKKLNVQPAGKVRGKLNQWMHTFNSESVEVILKYREGLENNLKKLKDGSYTLNK
jgi:transcriptional regulator with XRE-family HTH domain